MKKFTVLLFIVIAVIFFTSGIVNAQNARLSIDGNEAKAIAGTARGYYSDIIHNEYTKKTLIR